jgi:DNA primase
MIKYNNKVTNEIVLQFLIDGPAKEVDIVGSVMTLSAAMLPEYSIMKLQNTNLLGKLVVALQSTSTNKIRGILKIPSNLDRADTCILIAIIESIKKVHLYDSVFKFKEVVPTEKNNTTLWLKRALEIYNSAFQQMQDDSATNLKRTLLEMTSAKKAISYKSFTLGSRFHEADHIIVVEGKNDVEALAQCNINNVLGLGGYNFKEKDLEELLKSKKITLFTDGDQGGLAIIRKLSELYDIEYIIQTPKTKKVEELKKREILDLMKEKKIFSKKEYTLS